MHELWDKENSRRTEYDISSREEKDDDNVKCKRKKICCCSFFRFQFTIDAIILCCQQQKKTPNTDRKKKKIKRGEAKNPIAVKQFTIAAHWIFIHSFGFGFLETKSWLSYLAVEWIGENKMLIFRGFGFCLSLEAEHLSAIAWILTFWILIFLSKKKTNSKQIREKESPFVCHKSPSAMASCSSRKCVGNKM